ncbi:MAG: hypothetical protein EZS28_028844 [Streblomastix strix]|uniref:Uncharacterized protein n=1 Tax=Streblomastix strix TaxID=222440 RepID=A0A5J4UYN7_9EUKA|nr:MAG: hypothetical protein EZS28_028844 [Streblomastix strix]
MIILGDLPKLRGRRLVKDDRGLCLHAHLLQIFTISLRIDLILLVLVYESDGSPSEIVPNNYFVSSNVCEREINGEEAKQQGNRHSDLSGTGQFQTISSKHVSEITNSSQPKSQPPSLTKHSELGPLIGKIVGPKQRIQLIYVHNTRSKISLQTTTSNMPSRSSEARANTDSTSHFMTQQEKRKKANVVPDTEYQTNKLSSCSKTSG